MSDPAFRVSLQQRRAANPFSEGSRELFDLAGQGRIDTFFLGGAQIDGTGAINLVRADGKRFPGSFGSAYLYPVTKNVVLFREEHSRRVLVPKVDFVCGPGFLDGGDTREKAGLPPGGPKLIVTPLGVFDFAPQSRAMRVRSLNPGIGLEQVRDQTGFDLVVEGAPPTTVAPSAEELAVLRAQVDAGGVLRRKFA